MDKKDCHICKLMKTIDPNDYFAYGFVSGMICSTYQGSQEKLISSSCSECVMRITKTVVSADKAIRSEMQHQPAPKATTAPIPDSSLN